MAVVFFGWINFLAWNAKYLFGTELHNSNLIAGVVVNIFSDEIDSGTLCVQKLSHSLPLDPHLHGSRGNKHLLLQKNLIAPALSLRAFA